jgi:hypothetical protein
MSIKIGITSNIKYIVSNLKKEQDKGGVYEKILMAVRVL